MPGVNFQSVRGSQTGVFVGCGESECHEAWNADPQRATGYETVGCFRSMFANRLSFFFDLRGLQLCIMQIIDTTILSPAISQYYINVHRKGTLLLYRLHIDNIHSLSTTGSQNMLPHTVSVQYFW